MPINFFSVANHTVLVSGGDSDIGAYIAKGLADAGASRVYIVGRQAASLYNIAKHSPRVILPLIGDVTTIRGCKLVAEQFSGAEKKKVEKQGGSVTLDLLVHNVGLGQYEGDGAHNTAAPEKPNGPTMKILEYDWKKELVQNAASVHWLSAALLRYLVVPSTKPRAGRGSVVVNTFAAKLYVPLPAIDHIHNANRAAADNITQNLATRLARLDVRVNGIALANMTSQNKTTGNLVKHEEDSHAASCAGGEDDVVGAVIYFASMVSSRVSGTIIKVHGGGYS
ncbi:hypothetical protein EIP86_001329 [Pleurotus ostreatoroseus]|nr:hypothetical protein EIP86_001329 [Pleurotus ostreatoroseus]